jgi:hypothetical protein
VRFPISGSNSETPSLVNTWEKVFSPVFSIRSSVSSHPLGNHFDPALLSAIQRYLPPVMGSEVVENKDQRLKGC